MKKFSLIILLSAFLSSNLFAGCMTNEIKQVDASLSNDNISADKKVEIKELRKLIVANEHDNAELAFESYEKVMSLVN